MTGLGLAAICAAACGKSEDPHTRQKKAAASTVRCASAGKLVDRLPLPKRTGAAETISLAHLRRWVRLLTAPTLRGRRAFTPATKQVAGLIARHFAQSGLRPALPSGDYCQRLDRAKRTDQNVIARYVASGPRPAGATPRLIIGAHYDALGLNDKGQPYPGADDNASGVAALMELAHLLPRRKPPIDIELIAFGAEERGVIGSRYYVTHPAAPLAQVRLMINLDMVGRQLLSGMPYRKLLGEPRDHFGYVVSPRRDMWTLGVVRRAAQRTRVPVIGIPQALLTGVGFSADSVSFSPHTPALFISSSIHPDYHKITDTADRLDYGQIRRAVRLVLAVVDEVVNERRGLR